MNKNKYNDLATNMAKQIYKMIETAQPNYSKELDPKEEANNAVVLKNLLRIVNTQLDTFRKKIDECEVTPEEKREVYDILNKLQEVINVTFKDTK